MRIPKVVNMTSPKTGNPVANQFIIYFKDGAQVFQSYQSLIAYKDSGNNTHLDKNYWDYSKTTGKYRNEFLNEGIAETRRKIKEGVYSLVDLNK